MVNSSDRSNESQCGQRQPDAMVRDLPEEWCWKTLRELRWPVRVICPHCGNRAGRHCRERYAYYYRCRGCHRMFSDLAGTPFHGTCLPLNLWFVAIDRMVLGSRLPTSTLARFIGVDRKTARRITNLIWPLRGDPLIRSIAASILCRRIQIRVAEREAGVSDVGRVSWAIRSSDNPEQGPHHLDPLEASNIIEQGGYHESAE